MRGSSTSTYLLFLPFKTAIDRLCSEGWGQRSSGPEKHLAKKVNALDPTRLVNGARYLALHALSVIVLMIESSGWTDHGAGRFHDTHHYTEPDCRLDDIPGLNRIPFQGEFAGFGLNSTVDHLWNVPSSSQFFE